MERGVKEEKRMVKLSAKEQKVVKGYKDLDHVIDVSQISNDRVTCVLVLKTVKHQQVANSWICESQYKRWVHMTCIMSLFRTYDNNFEVHGLFYC